MATCTKQYQLELNLRMKSKLSGSCSVNLRKVATQLGLNLAEVGRASLTAPQRYDLFTRLDKSYRKRSEERLEAALRYISLESPVFLTRGDVKYC